MALFQVDGWDLKNEKVAPGLAPNKKKEKKDKKKAKKVEAAVHEKESREQKTKEKSKETTTEKPKKETSSEGVDKKSKKRKHQEDEKIEVDQTPTSLDKPLPVSTNKLTPLQQKMMAKLSGSRFRWINEQLYTISSEDALKLIKQQPSLFDEYHQGFRSQVQSWPENPVDVFVEQIKERGSTRQVNAPGGLPGLPNKQVVVADMGCGEAQLALDVNNFTKQYNKANKGKQNKKFGKKNNGQRNGGPTNLNVEVHSFDLKKVNDRITVADIKNVPLEDESCSVVIFCLALMGTNFLDFIKEAYRILAPRGELWIAEIKSRFTELASASNKPTKPEDIGAEFVDALKLCGFFHKKTDNDNKMFTRFEFFKPPQDIIDERRAKLDRKKKFIEQQTEKENFDQKREDKPEGEWLLKPCIYKRR